MKEFKNNIHILTIMTGINLLVLWNFVSEGQAKHGIGYFIFFYVAIFIIHSFTKKITPKNDIVVKEPIKEAGVATVFALLGVIFLALTFSLRLNILQDILPIRIPVLLGNLMFATPLGIVLYLLVKKYKVYQLGLKVNPLIYLLLGLVIWGLTGLFAFVFNETGIRWERAYKELGGLAGIIIQGVIGAALFEEFSRFVLQSRFEKVIQIPGLNILFATTIWAFMHFPVNWSKGSETFDNLTYCIQIIPLGFIWGYLTHRTRSILPSTIAHGLNLWGLQNG